jgi:hypothetical protein
MFTVALAACLAGSSLGYGCSSKGDTVFESNVGEIADTGGPFGSLAATASPDQAAFSSTNDGARSFCQWQVKFDQKKPDYEAIERYTINSDGSVTTSPLIHYPDSTYDLFGTGLNINGTLVGTQYPYVLDGTSKAFMVNGTSGVVYLNPLVGGTNSKATCIDDQNNIYGTSDAPDHVLHAVKWIQGMGTPIDLTPKQNGAALTNDTPVAANNEGDVVVTQKDQAGLGHIAVLTKDSLPYVLPSTGVDIRNPVAISQHGLIVGNSGGPSGLDAWTFDVHTNKFTDIGTPPGTLYLLVRGVNLSGTVVAQAGLTNGGQRGYEYNGSWKDINSLFTWPSVVSITDALGIADNGRLILYGTDSGVPHYFVRR